MRILKKTITSVLLSLMLFTSFNTVYADETNTDENVMYWGINNGTLYLSPTKQGYAINKDDRDTKWKNCNAPYIELWCDWYEYADSIKVVEILSDGDLKIKPITTIFWFYEFKNCYEINGINNLDTSVLEDCTEMFYECESLKEVDLQNFSTDNVIYFTYLFAGCENLESLDVSKFNTSNAQKLDGMFAGCEKLKTIDVTNFDTSNAWDISDMFSGCKLLKTIDLSSFNTENVEDFSYLFNYCTNLEYIDISNFDFNKAELSLSGMFQHCSKLKEIDLQNIKTENILYFNYLFSGCNSLKEIDISSFDTRSITNSVEMFAGCTSLEKIIVSDKWVKHKYLRNGDENMFLGCINLVGQSGTKYDENNIGIEYAIVDEGEKNPGYLTLKTIEEPIIEETTTDDPNIQTNKPSFTLYAIIAVIIVSIVGIVLKFKKKQ